MLDRRSFPSNWKVCRRWNKAITNSEKVGREAPRRLRKSPRIN